MKRPIIAAVALSLAAAVTAYYSVPELFKEPLAQLNRKLSGLSEKTVRVGPHEVHYLDGGSGAPVLLLHGIFAEKDHWVDFARPLTGGYRVLVPDLPGFGESGRVAGESYNYDAQTRRLKELLDNLGIERAHIAGNSMGGTIAALFAIRYPDRVASVALIGAPHGIRSPQPSEADRLIDAGKTPLIAHDEAEFEQMLERVFARRPFLPYPILHAARADAVRNAESNLHLWRAQLQDRFLLHERIGELRTRTIALWGAQDRIFHASGVDVLRARLANADVRVLAEIGHLPMMEAPADTARIYAQFLAGMEKP